jgi:hypothetical protein
METINRLDNKMILEVFELFKNDPNWHYKFTVNAPIVFNDDFCELSLILGYEATTHYLTIPTHVFNRYGDEFLEEEGIYKEARMTIALGGTKLTEEEAEGIYGDDGVVFYYTRMKLTYEQKMEFSEFIIDKLFWDLFSEYKYTN